MSLLPREQFIVQHSPDVAGRPGAAVRDSGRNDGPVNAGDSAGLHKLLLEAGNPDFDVDREMGFAKRLFADVDRPGSPVNVVVGARRFIAGWNSWRVSTMGLMHVGVGEGPEIIQMFGRGVRLQGWNTSLKRHRESEAPTPPDGAMLAELETLYIFGLRADYMRTFRELLRNEGVRAEQETVSLPVTWNFARKTDLKLIRLRDIAAKALARRSTSRGAQGPLAIASCTPASLSNSKWHSS